MHTNLEKTIKPQIEYMSSQIFLNRAFHNIHGFKSVVNVYNFLISLFLKVAFSRLEFGDNIVYIL